MDASTDAWEASIGDGSEAKLRQGAADLFEVGGKQRLPRSGCGRCWVGGRHYVVEEMGEARSGGVGCQSGQLGVRGEMDVDALFGFFPEPKL